jgi:hypothetical protein
MVFTSRNWFAMQGPAAIILISWNVIFIWETGYWTRAKKRFALFILLHIFGNFMILKLKSSRLLYILVLIWPLSSNSRYKFKNDADEAVYVVIPMGTNCAPLLADLVLYSYESEFLQKLVKDKKIHEARAFNFTYRYIDDARSSMFYLYEFCLKNMWNCSLTQQMLSHSFYD